MASLEPLTSAVLNSKCAPLCLAFSRAVGSGPHPISQDYSGEGWLEGARPMAASTAACSRVPLGRSLCDSRLSLERPRGESELGPPQPLPLRWVIFSLLWDPRLIHFLCCLAFLSAVASCCPFGLCQSVRLMVPRVLATLLFSVAVFPVTLG